MLEAQHGTNILVTIPSIIVPGKAFLISVQVKDWANEAGLNPVDQVLKADQYWNKDGQLLISKVVVQVRANEDDNMAFVDYAREKGVEVARASSGPPIPHCDQKDASLERILQYPIRRL